MVKSVASSRWEIRIPIISPHQETQPADSPTDQVELRPRSSLRDVRLAWPRVLPRICPRLVPATLAAVLLRSLEQKEYSLLRGVGDVHAEVTVVDELESQFHMTGLRYELILVGFYLVVIVVC